MTHKQKDQYIRELEEELLVAKVFEQVYYTSLDFDLEALLKEAEGKGYRKGRAEAFQEIGNQP